MRQDPGARQAAGREARGRVAAGSRPTAPRPRPADQPPREPAPRTPTLLRRLEWTVSGGSTACCRATTARCCAAPASTWPTCASTSCTTTCATSTGTSRRACRRRTCACSHEDREMAAWFLLDLSRLGGFRLAANSASATLSAEFVAVLARLLTRHGNRVGAMLYGNGVDARDSRARRPAPRAAPAAPHADAARACAATGSATRSAPTCSRRRSRVIKRRSMVFVVSDFISEPGWERPLAHAGAAPRGGRRAPATTRWNWSCPTWA